jgi:iron(III) transport system substrate-binding protein
VPAAKDPEGRWNGTYAIYDTPAYNTAKVKPEELPKSYEDFAHHPEWANHVAIDFTDGDWLEGIFNHYGEAKARTLIGDMVRVLKPSLVKGHLAVARAVGAGEYWVALNNYINLTLNVKLGGAPIDFWVLDPVIATYGKVAASAQAPHPNAAKLGVEFLLSAEAQAQRTTAGRIPTNPDVPTNPPDIRDHFPKTDTVLQSTDDKAKWQKTFDEFFKQ